MQTRFERSPSRLALLVLSLLAAVPGLGALATESSAVEAAVQAEVLEEVEAVPFELRSPFETMSAEAPAIVARRVGAAAGDVYGLALHAVGEVGSLRVADIGAGRGRHLSGLANKIGSKGRLFATELDEASCAALRTAASEAGHGNVTVVQADKTDVGLEPTSIDVALLSDVYQFVTLLDGRSGQDKHAFMTSLQSALVPGGEVVVSYVTSAQLKQEATRDELLEKTVADFSAYGFELGRRWILDGLHWPLLLLEFRFPAAGPLSPGVYMGREIATTMHWSGADWLLRSERESEEATSRMLEALAVQPGWTMTDFGCGNGYHTLELARRAGPTGKVYGVDIQPQMLKLLESRAAEAGLDNVVPVLGSALDAALPEGHCDLILVADVYHELSHPVPMLAAMRRALAPEGRIAMLEFRAEDPEVPIKPEHKMTRAQIVAEFEANGFQLDEECLELPWQHLLFFRAN